MATLVIFSILFFTAFSADDACSSYSCKPDDVQFAANQCLGFNSTMSAYFIEPCEDGKYCQITSSPTDPVYCTDPPAPANVTRYPGEKCNTTSKKCVNGNKMCSNGVCSGKKAMAMCTDHWECDVGMYCDGYCMPQIQIDFDGCHDDYSCVNNAGCNVTLPQMALEQTGTCRKYMSIPPHNVSIGYCNDESYSNLCSSLLCSSFNTTGALAYCADPVMTKEYTPLPCEDDTVWVGATDMWFKTVGWAPQSKCECGYNPSGDQYCNLFPGDQPYQDYREWLNKWYNSTEVLKCNTLHRENSVCMQDWWDETSFTAFSYFWQWKTYYPQFQQNDECVREVYTSDYWILKTAYNELDFDDNDDNDFALYLATGFLSLIYYF